MASEGFRPLTWHQKISPTEKEPWKEIASFPVNKDVSYLLDVDQTWAHVLCI